MPAQRNVYNNTQQSLCISQAPITIEVHG